MRINLQQHFGNTGFKNNQKVVHFGTDYDRYDPDVDHIQANKNNPEQSRIAKARAKQLEADRKQQATTELRQRQYKANQERDLNDRLGIREQP